MCCVCLGCVGYYVSPQFSVHDSACFFIYFAQICLVSYTLLFCFSYLQCCPVNVKLFIIVMNSFFVICFICHDKQFKTEKIQLLGFGGDIIWFHVWMRISASFEISIYSVLINHLLGFWWSGDCFYVLMWILASVGD